MVFHIFLYVCICLYPRVQDVAVILVSHMPEGCPGRASTNSDAWPFVKATVFRHGRNLEVGWGSSMDELLVFCFFFFGWTKKAEVSIPLEHWRCLRLHWHHLRFWCFELIIWAELILTYAVRMSRYMLEIAICGGMPRQVQIQMWIFIDHLQYLTMQQVHRGKGKTWFGWQIHMINLQRYIAGT